MSAPKVFCDRVNCSKFCTEDGCPCKCHKCGKPVISPWWSAMLQGREVCAMPVNHGGECGEIVDIMSVKRNPEESFGEALLRNLGPHPETKE